MADTRDIAQEVIERQKRSNDWLETNFYGEWEIAWKAYLCERDPELDPNTKKPDPTQSSVGMPDTWGFTRRQVARITANIPNLRHHARDRDKAEMISRSLMYQWDQARMQRTQKRHVLQAVLFGWSVKSWYWAEERSTRRKRLKYDPVMGFDPQHHAEIAKAYGVPPESLTDPMVHSGLMARFARSKMLPVSYEYCSYIGPKCDFIFIGDAFPEPNLEDLQSSEWFIVERKRDRAFLDKLALFDELKAGVKALLEKHPNGMPHDTFGNQDRKRLRARMWDVIDKAEYPQGSATTNASGEWIITEQHTRGPNGKITYVCDKELIGEIPYPYDLDGNIAFTDLVLIPSLLSGVGDSTPRIMRGLQWLHDRQVNTRTDLVDNLNRPLVGTTDRQLLENPDLVKRYKGMRLVHMRGPGAMWVQPEQAAMAAVATGLQDESAIMRMIQVATGDSNMAMGANVDPAQNRTATGARISAYNQDVLTKDAVDMFTESLSADAQMMFRLNRSEMSEPIEFEAEKYNRTYSATGDAFKDQWVQVEPDLFMIDAEITAEAGSTLADDDEAKVQRATALFQTAASMPMLFNLEKARDEFLIAHGKGRELQQWAAPPPPPPPPPVPDPAKVSVSMKYEELGPQEKGMVLKQAFGVDVDVQEAPPEMDPAMGGPPPPGGPPMGGPPPMPDMPPPPIDSAMAAASGYQPGMEVR